MQILCSKLTLEELLLGSSLFFFFSPSDAGRSNCLVITGVQPKAGTGLRMQTVRFFNVTLLGIYRCLRYIAGSLKSYPPF